MCARTKKSFLSSFLLYIPRIDIKSRDIYIDIHRGLYILFVNKRLSPFKYYRKFFFSSNIKKKSAYSIFI